MDKTKIEVTKAVEYRTLQEVIDIVSELGLSFDEVTIEAITAEWDDERTCHISYYREETDEEYQKRIEKDKKQKIKIEQLERQRYFELRKKYENKV